MPRATKLGREREYNEEQDPSIMWSRKSREKLDLLYLYHHKPYDHQT